MYAKSETSKDDELRRAGLSFLLQHAGSRLRTRTPIPMKVTLSSIGQMTAIVLNLYIFMYCPIMAIMYCPIMGTDRDLPFEQ